MAIRQVGERAWQLILVCDFIKKKHMYLFVFVLILFECTLHWYLYASAYFLFKKFWEFSKKLLIKSEMVSFMFYDTYK